MAATVILLPFGSRNCVVSTCLVQYSRFGRPNCILLHSLQMEPTSCSEKSVTTHKITWRHNPTKKHRCTLLSKTYVNQNSEEVHCFQYTLAAYISLLLRYSYCLICNDCNVPHYIIS